MSQVIVLQTEDDLRILSESIADKVLGIIQERMADTNTDQKLLTPKDVAEMLGISRDQVYAMVREGQIPCYRIGSLMRFYPEEVIAALERKEVTA